MKGRENKQTNSKRNKRRGKPLKGSYKINFHEVSYNRTYSKLHVLPVQVKREVVNICRRPPLLFLSKGRKEKRKGKRRGNGKQGGIA